MGTVLHRFGYAIYTEVPSDDFNQMAPILENMVSSFRISNLEGVIPYAQWSRRSSAHFTFYYYSNSNAARDIDTIVFEHESGFDNITRTIEVSYHGKVDYYLYPSENILYRMTRRPYGFAMAEDNECHVLYASRQERQSVGHEATHVIPYHTLGEPSETLLGEGIAVALDQSSDNHDKTVAELIFLDRYVPLASLLGENWFKQDQLAAYKQSGSFVKFLIDRYGITKFKQLYVSENFLAALQTIYGWGLAELEDEWKTAVSPAWEEEEFP